VKTSYLACVVLLYIQFSGTLAQTAPWPIQVTSSGKGITVTRAPGRLLNEWYTNGNLWQR